MLIIKKIISLQRFMENLGKKKADVLSTSAS